MKKRKLQNLIFTLIIIFIGTNTVINLFGSLRSFKSSFVELMAQTSTKDVYKNSKLDTARKVKYLNDLEKDVVLELNKVRSNPPQYAKTQLTRLKSYYLGNSINYPGRIIIYSREGVKAVDECINVLLKTKPMGIFSPSEGLSKAARDHVKDQSISNKTGHYGKDGSSPFDRMNRYGKWLYMAAENIDYGYDQADLIVMSLLVDDGVPDRGHRTNILNPNLKVVGVASGKHRTYRHMLVMDFAKAYK